MPPPQLTSVQSRLATSEQRTNEAPLLSDGRAHIGSSFYSGVYCCGDGWHRTPEAPHMSEPILWMALGALAVQAALFYAKELLPVHFWALTVFNWACLFALPYAIHAAYL